MWCGHVAQRCVTIPLVMVCVCFVFYVWRTIKYNLWLNKIEKKIMDETFNMQRTLGTYAPSRFKMWMCYSQKTCHNKIIAVEQIT